MKNTVSKEINSLNNPEYKFLISLKKNRNRKKENKSILNHTSKKNNLLISLKELIPSEDNFLLKNLPKCIYNFLHLFKKHDKKKSLISEDFFY